MAFSKSYLANFAQYPIEEASCKDTEELLFSLFSWCDNRRGYGVVKLRTAASRGLSTPEETLDMPRDYTDSITGQTFFGRRSDVECHGTNVLITNTFVTKRGDGLWPAFRGTRKAGPAVA